jgi:hypothetical protein
MAKWLTLHRRSRVKTAPRRGEARRGSGEMSDDECRDSHTLGRAKISAALIIQPGTTRLTEMVRSQVRRPSFGWLRRLAFRVALLPCATTCLTGCGGNSGGELAGSTPYDPGYATIIGDAGDEGPVSTAGCRDATCETTRDRCGTDGAADVIVDADGTVVDVICYGQDVSVVHVPVDKVSSYTTPGNNAVLVIDGVDDGVDIAGDVTVSGNNAVIYGSGPDTSVIGGTVMVEKNNARIRGVRILGDLTIDKNNTKLVDCVIEGNLNINGNNTTIAACDVLGAVTIRANNTVLVDDRFGGTDAISGGNLTCSGDVRFDDVNGDRVVDSAEVRGPVACDG